jgi:PAS domain-containing protein
VLREYKVASPDLLGDVESALVFANGESDSQAVRLRTALERSRHPMLIADDQRRWVTGNAAACDLLEVAGEDIPWRTMDEFTSPGERKRLEEQWGAFLASGGAEGLVSAVRSGPRAGAGRVQCDGQRASRPPPLCLHPA